MMKKEVKPFTAVHLLKIPGLVFLCLLVLFLSITGCDDDEVTGDFSVKVKISDIKNLSSDTIFNRVSANIVGNNWHVVATVEVACENGELRITLPATFSPEQLQQVNREEGISGYWPVESDNPEAGVATLGDIIAYRGSDKVGRIYYASEPYGTGASTQKAYLHYQYADQAFTLSGYDKNYRYSNCSFVTGWNLFAKVNLLNDSSLGTGNNLCTTSIPAEVVFSWYFESWEY